MEKLILTLCFGFTYVPVAMGWNCTYQASEYYARVGSAATLQFNISLILPPSSSAGTFHLFFYNGTYLAFIRYQYGTIIKQEASGVNITGDELGNIEVRLQNVQEDSAGTYRISTGDVPPFFCSCLYILGVVTQPVLTFTKDPSVGENITLTCSSNSTTRPTNHSLNMLYNWKVDNLDYPNDTRYSYSTSRNLLTLSEVVKDDARKQFTCSAMEDVNDGYISAWSGPISFSVIYGPEKIRFNPADTSYKREENTFLQAVLCEADCYPTCIFRWTKAENGSTATDTASLQLGNLTRAESGTYKCTATRSGSVSATKELVLSVVYAPKVTIRLLPSTATLGRGFKILCEAYDGFPEDYNYKGFIHTYNGQVIPIFSPPIFGTPQNTSLHILSVRIQDMGTYSCSVNNGISSSGTIDQTASVDISFEAQPEILLEDREYFGSISGTIKVLVPFYSLTVFQNLTITRSDGLEIMNSDKYNLAYVRSTVASSFYGVIVFLNGTVLHFIIKGITTEDFSSYVIVISNDVGYVSTEISINQKGHPLQPQDFKVSIFPGVLLFSWTSSSNGGDEQSFLVQMSREGTNRWDNQTLVHESDAGHMITVGHYVLNVTEPTQGFYQCRIIALNSLGYSEAVYLQRSIEIKQQTEDKSTEAGEYKRDLVIGITLGTAIIGLIVGVIILAIKLQRHNHRGDSASAKLSASRKNRPLYGNLAYVEEFAQQDVRAETINTSSPGQGQYSTLEDQLRDDHKLYDVITSAQ